MTTEGVWLLWCTVPGLGVGRHFLGNTRPLWFRVVIDLSWQSGAAFHSPSLHPFSTVSSFFLSVFVALTPQKAGCITVGWNATIGPGLLRSSFWLPLALFACLRHVYAVRTMHLYWYWRRLFFFNQISSFLKKNKILDRFFRAQYRICSFNEVFR